MKKTTIALLAALIPLPMIGQLLIEDFDYGDGELNALSFGTWSAYDDAGIVPFAVISDRALVIDYTQGTTFAGDYQTRSPRPEQKAIMQASFYLKLTSPVLDEEGAPIGGLADIDCPSCYRGRIFLKKGEGTDAYRIGLAAQGSTPIAPEGYINTYWYAQDLQLDETYLIRIKWDNDNLVARLWVDSNEEATPTVEVVGGTARRNSLRRFGVEMNSEHPLGRIVIDNLRMGEAFEDVTQPVLSKAPFEVPFRTYEDRYLGNYEEIGGGWTLWYPDLSQYTWGFMYLPARNRSGSGWHFHGTHGWIYLVEGNMEEGLWAYGATLEWVFTRADFEGQFYHYKDAMYRYWLQGI